MGFGSDSEDSAVKGRRELERSDCHSDEAELQSIMQLEQYVSDEGFIVGDDESLHESLSDGYSLASFERESSDEDGEAHMEDDDDEREDLPLERDSPALGQRRKRNRRAILSDSEGELDQEPQQASPALSRVGSRRRAIVEDEDEDDKDERKGPQRSVFAVAQRNRRRHSQQQPVVVCSGDNSEPITAVVGSTSKRRRGPRPTRDSSVSPSPKRAKIA